MVKNAQTGLEKNFLIFSSSCWHFFLLQLFYIDAFSSFE